MCDGCRHRNGTRDSALENWMETEKLNSTYCLEIIKKDAPVQYSAGFLAGVLKVVEVIVKENYKQLNIGECLKTIEWENIPHVAQILEVIYKNPRIQHARLAEMIDISSATLTGIMKRMTDAGMVEFIRSGKFKYGLFAEGFTAILCIGCSVIAVCKRNDIVNPNPIFAAEPHVSSSVRLAIANNTQQHIPFCCFAGTFNELRISFASSNLLIYSSSKYCHKLLPTYP